MWIGLTACEPTPPPEPPVIEEPVEVTPSVTIRPQRPAIQPADGKTADVPQVVDVAGVELEAEGLLVRLYLDGQPVVDT